MNKSSLLEWFSIPEALVWIETKDESVVAKVAARRKHGCAVQYGAAREQIKRRLLARGEARQTTDVEGILVIEDVERGAMDQLRVALESGAISAYANFKQGDGSIKRKCLKAETWPGLEIDTNLGRKAPCGAYSWEAPDEVYGDILFAQSQIFSVFKIEADQKYDSTDTEIDPASNPVPRIKLPNEAPGRNESPTRAAWIVMRKRWPDGVPKDKKTTEISRLVNIEIKKLSRENYPFSEVSVETVARLLNRKK